MQKIRLILLSLLLFSLTSITAQTISVSNPNPKYGVFSTYSLQVKPLYDGTRRVRLLEELVYIDPRGKRWTAPKGAVVDGASIPRIFQNVIGTPYGGEYTLASVIHDVACYEQTEPWEEVHQMFYDAMLASGVEEQKASTMYLAVYEGGARWGENRYNHLMPKRVLDLLSGNGKTTVIGALRPFVDELLLTGLEKSGTKLNTLLDSLQIKVEESAESLVSQIDGLNRKIQEEKNRLRNN
jgi:hypothetical protein